MKTKTKGLWTTAIAALFLVVLLGGCKKDDFVEVTGVCPAVVWTSPINMATNVPLDKIITAKFNENMDPATITPESFTIEVTAKGEMAIAGTLSYSDSTATFTPSSPLTASKTYIGTIASTVKDLMGNSLQADYIWSFSTGATLAPAVISTDPINNATGVVLNKVVMATFSVPMDPLTITSTTFTLKQGLTAITGVVTYSGSTASFTPSAALVSNTLYTATITTGAKNVPGVALANNYVWKFTTGTILAPTVILTDPLNNAAGVPLNKVISATFSEVMNPLTITTSTFTVKNGATSVLGVISNIGSTYTFTLAVSLLSDAVYTATITTGAMSPSGTPITSNYVWTFSTIAHKGPLAPPLLTVARFGIISGVGVTNAAGASIINNLDVGIYPGARTLITGFFVVDGGPGLINNGAFYAADDIAPPGVPAMLNQAKLDLVAAYLFAEGATSPAPAIVAGDQGGTTLAPGIYKSTSSLLIQSGNLTLDAQGDVNAVWIFQIASNLTTVGGSPFPSPAGGNVILTGGAQAKNVYWQVGVSAVIGDYTSFKGNILALTSITMNAYSVAEGRILTQNAAVTLTSTNIINKP